MRTLIAILIISALAHSHVIHIKAPAYISEALKSTPVDDNNVIAILSGKFHETLVIPHHIHYIQFTTQLYQEGKAISRPNLEDVEAIIVGDGHHAFSDSLASVSFDGIGFTIDKEPSREPLFYSQMSYEVHFDKCSFSGIPYSTISSMDHSRFRYDCFVDPRISMYTGPDGDGVYASISDAIETSACGVILVGQFDRIWPFIKNKMEASIYMTSSKLYNFPSEDALTYEESRVMRVTVEDDNINTLRISNQDPSEEEMNEQE